MMRQQVSLIVFFKQLKNGTTKDIAIRKAKLKYLTDSNVPPDRHHPLFWAGFVPIGDMTPLYTPSELSKNWTLLASLSMLALTLFLGSVTLEEICKKRKIIFLNILDFKSHIFFKIKFTRFFIKE